jgi:hypothetical protein
VAETRTWIRKVFLVSTACSCLGWIKEELTERGIEARTADELVSAGMSVPDLVETEIRRSDLVIGVVDSQSPPVLFYELGMARGLGKPVLLVVSSAYEREHVPPLLTGVVYVRADASNRQAVGFALDQLPATYGTTSRRPARRAPTEHTLGSEVDTYLELINSRAATLTEQELQGLVEDLLKAAGVSQVIRSPSPGQSADFAVWSDDLQSSVGNPLLIEVKSHIRDAAHLQEVLSQVEAYRRSSSTEWALVVLPALEGPIPRAYGQAYVLALTVAELIEGLRKRSFSEVVRDLRNTRIHEGARDG